MNHDLKDFVINQNANINLGLELINKNGGHLLIVVNDDFELVGALSDGDLRRAFLSGVSIDGLVKEAMNPDPVSLQQNEEGYYLNDTCELMPIVDDQGKVVNLFFRNQSQEKDIPVLIMAGGLGSRLGSLTESLPKPMLKVGGKVILERIIDSFKKYGFFNFYISVNYKAEIIEDYFGNGESFGCQITYLRENKRLGTAGALSLLPENLDTPVLVSNGDILTEVNFDHMVRHFYKNKSGITMCVREYKTQIPYGVVKVEDNSAVSFFEKPVERHLVNAGMYLIDQKLLSHVPKDEYYDMSTFLNSLLEKGVYPKCFYLNNSWIDIGQVKDLEMARSSIGK